MTQNWISQAIFGGNQTRLSAQRPDQRWVQEIFPSRNHADPTRHTADTTAGGLIGDLSILIGLIALSVSHGRVGEAVRHCIRDLGPSGGWRRHGRNHLRKSALRHACAMNSSNATDAAQEKTVEASLSKFGAGLLIQRMLRLRAWRMGITGRSIAEAGDSAPRHPLKSFFFMTSILTT
jgi:hypothetical protein